MKRGIFINGMYEEKQGFWKKISFNNRYDKQVWKGTHKQEPLTKKTKVNEVVEHESMGVRCLWLCRRGWCCSLCRNKRQSRAMIDFDDCDYTDLRAVRAKKLDGMENYEPSDNYLLNEDIRLILVKEYGWSCLEYDDTYCGQCIARNYCNAVAERY